MQIDISLSSEGDTSELSAYPQKCGSVRIAHLSVLPHKEEVFNLMLMLKLI